MLETFFHIVIIGQNKENGFPKIAKRSPEACCTLNFPHFTSGTPHQDFKRVTSTVNEEEINKDVRPS